MQTIVIKIATYNELGFSCEGENKIITELETADLQGNKAKIVLNQFSVFCFNVRNSVPRISRSCNRSLN